MARKICSTNPPRKVGSALSAAFAGAMIYAGSVAAQVPTATLSGLPATPLIGETFCFDVNFSNAGGSTGFGPYLVETVDAGIAQLSASFVDIAPRESVIGIFDASGVLTDPISGLPVSGNDNGTANLINYPVGSVDTGQQPLVMNFCATAQPGVEVGVPLDVGITPGFQFGDTATGTNGPLVGSEIASTVTPILARVKKSNTAPEGERPPGPDFVYNYQWQIDVSEQVTIEDVLLTDSLPPAVQWTGGAITVNAPLGNGCSVTGFPGTPPTAGGDVVVECDALTGTSGEQDLVVTVPVYITDILDETRPDEQTVINTVEFDYQYLGQSYNDSDTSEVRAVHSALQKSVAGTALPGETLTYTVDFQVTDYPGGPGSGAGTFLVTDILPDGVNFDSTIQLQLNGAVIPIVPTVSPDVPAAGQTTVVWDIGNALGGILPNGSTGTLRYAAMIAEFYSVGGGTVPVQGADVLSNNVDLTYGLTQGGSGNDASSAAIEILPNTADKTIRQPNPLPAELQPGTAVTFGLSLEIPSGKSSNVVFTDFLPRPVFDVADFNTATDWNVLPPFDALTPTVTKNAGANSVTLDFGDISAPSGATLLVELTATITGEPFSDDLFLTNLMSSSYDNAAGDTTEDLQAVGITVGAPELSLTKGVLDIDNPRAQITPPAPANPRTQLVEGDGAGADSGDAIQYVITVENTGSQPAYSVTITDTVPAGMSCDPIAPGDVVNGDNTPLAFAAPGDLFGPQGLVLDDPLAGNDNAPAGGGAPFAADTALVTVNCTLQATVTPGETLTNTASVTWVSTAGGTELFPAQQDDATITIDIPQLRKSVVGVTPGYSGNLLRPHVGELVTYELQVTVPEGTSANARLEDVLDAGLAHVDVLSVTASSAALSSTAGDFDTDILNNAGFLGNGSGPTAPDRKLVFGPGNNDNGFGTITNADTDNNTDEVITITYRTRVLNAVSNTNGQRLRNRARWFWKPADNDRQQVQVRAPQVQVIEADLALTKVFNPDTGDNLTPPAVTMTIDHSPTSTADAYDLTFVDPLPRDMAIVGGAGGVTLNNCPATTRLDVQRIGLSDTLFIDFAEFPRANGLCTVSFDTSFLVQVTAGATLENCAAVEWESMADINQPADGSATNAPGIAVERTGDLNDPGAAANSYQREACDQYKVFGVGINKSVLSSSQPQTDNIPGTPAGAESLTIGEEVTFELIVTLPEASAVGLTVVDSLPKTSMVIELLNARIPMPGGIGADINLPGGVVPPPVLSDTSGNGINDTVGFDFGLVGHTLDGMTDDRDRIRILVDAKVLDRTENANGDLDENAGIVRFSNRLSASDSYGIEIVEPLLKLQKSANTDRVEAGDEITYTLRIEHTSASRVDAQDIELSDLLPAELSLIGGSAGVAPSCTVPPDSGPSEGANTINASWATFPLGAICEIEYRATVNITAITGQDITNTANLDWTSLDTTGDADDRQYNLQDTWSVVISPPGLAKDMTATSVPDTDFSLEAPSQDLTIGEEATFTLVADFPDGTTRDVRIADLLPEVGVKLGYVSSQILSIGSDLVISGGPAVGDPASDCTPAQDNCREWVLGNVVNAPDVRPEPDSNDAIVFEVVAVVLDDPLNSGAPGQDDNLLNTASLTSPDAMLMATDQFNLVEPLLEVRKLTQNGTFEDSTAAGEQHVFTLEIKHQANSTATALNIEVVDTLSPQMEWVNDNAVSSSCPDLRLDTAPASGSSGPLSFSFDRLPLASGSCTISFPVEMNDTLPVPGVYENALVMTWESAPGAAQSRQYEARSQAQLSASNDAFMLKEVSATSVPETGTAIADNTLNDAAIGEVIEYVIVAKFTEGVTENVQLIDTLQQDAAGSLELLGGTVTFIGSNISTSLPGTPVISGNTITIDYGTVTNVADGVQDANDTVVYRLELLVSDVPENTSGDVLTNEVDMPYLDINGRPQVITDTARVDVVEPQLEMVKTFTGLAGAEATIELELTNSGNAAAYDVQISDAFDESLWVPGSLAVDSVPPGFDLTAVSAAGFTTVTLAPINAATPPSANEILEPGETLTVTFSLLLQNDGQPGPTSIPNTALAEATSLPGINPQERLYSVAANDTLLLPAIDLEKTWSGPNTPARPGDTLTYTLTLSNTGEAPVTDVMITDTPDALGTLVTGSVTPTTAGNGAVNATVVSGNTPGDTGIQVDIASLAGGAVLSVSYEVEVPLPYPDGLTALEQYTNQADAVSNELPAITSDDPDTAAEDDATIVPINADPVMTISKDDQVVFALPGDTLVYALQYGNAGDQDATGVVITETVPNDSVFNSAASTAGWSCADGAPAGSPCTLAIGNLGGASVATALFAVTIDNPVPGGVISITNTVSIEEDGAEFGQPPSVPSTAMATEITPLDARPDLQILKTDGGIAVVPGQAYSFRIIYRNSGSQEATGLELTEVVPNDVVFSAAQSAPSVWSCPDGSLPGTVCTLNGGSLQGGFGRDARFGVRVLAPAAAGVDTILNSVDIEDDGLNTPLPLTASDTDTTPLIAVPSLSITKRSNAGVVRVNDIIIYELGYTNSGNQDATGAIVREVVPAGTTYSAGDSAPTVWSCADGAPAGTVCEFVIGNLDVGDSGTLNFAVLATEIPDSERITNIVVINNDGSNGIDPTPGNNVAEVTNSFPVPSIPTLAFWSKLMLILGLAWLALQCLPRARMR